MRVFRRVLVVVCVSLWGLCLAAVAPAQPLALGQSSDPVQSSDQAVAERILGPRWQQLSRRAGMIFVGTVLGGAAPDSESVAAGKVSYSVQVRFRVDRAIAGVESGQILTIHEWAGASSLHRPMVGGQHLLLFLYPPSRLGLTSPVDGSLGQILLDSRGEYVSKDELLRRNAMTALQTMPVGAAQQPSATVSVGQLERAIRSARKE